MVARLGWWRTSLSLLRLRWVRVSTYSFLVLWMKVSAAQGGRSRAGARAEGMGCSGRGCGRTELDECVRAARAVDVVAEAGGELLEELLEVVEG